MNPPSRVLIVDDEPAVREMLGRVLRPEGYEILQAGDGQQALALIQQEKPDLLLLDIRMPGLDGLEILRRAKALDRDLPVVMVTSNALVQDAVAAMRAGSDDYLVKPLEPADVIRSVRSALMDRGFSQTARRSPAQAGATAGLQDMMGSSDAIATLSAEVARVACSEFSVLILGETGTGKEIVAQAIHDASWRASGPFVAVDCGAIPETLFENEFFGHEKGAFTGSDRNTSGKFELARGGTLFFDEVSNLALGSQAKLLRVLQERKVCRVGGIKSATVDVRAIAASNEDLAAAASKPAFRRDLFFRLDEFTIRIPPLRERKQDVVFLAKRFLDQASRELQKPVRGLTERAVERLLGYDWPGNVRQLRSAIRRAALLADAVIDEQHLNLPTDSHSQQDDSRIVLGESNDLIPLKQRIRSTVMIAEQVALRQALTAADGNKAKAARMLHIDYKTLHTKLKEYGIGRLGGENVQKNR